ncbi:hypothetical protein [Cryptosporangium minutisporangium]|uniref:Secreted protein n=1 Tax=Cryptosporangium minutisporangium TaxID=113569 RepID=A0ABP6T8I3_9ACTN
MALVFGGATAVSIGVSSAGESAAVQSAAPREDCGGLDTALRNNLNFIADQQRNPDAQSTARIANRQAVVDLIQQRRAVAGCTAVVVADAAPGQPAAPAPTTAAPAPATSAPPANGNGDAAEGDVVCAGSTVTLSGEEGGTPAASSNQFPAGTRLRVTNLDNNKSITVEVTGPSGSCVLLNNAAFEQVREPGKFLIRRAVIERVG